MNFHGKNVKSQFVQKQAKNWQQNIRFDFIFESFLTIKNFVAVNVVVTISLFLVCSDAH